MGLYFTRLKARLAGFNRMVPQFWKRHRERDGFAKADIVWQTRRCYSAAAVLILLYPGPKARKEKERNQVLRAGCEERSLLWRPNGVRGRGSGDLLGTFVSLQKYLARGRNIPSSKLLSRPLAKCPDGRPQAAPTGFNAPIPFWAVQSAAPLPHPPQCAHWGTFPQRKAKGS